MKTQQELINLLKAKNISYNILGNKSGSLVVVPEKGARICSVSVDGENLFWSWKEKIEQNDWNFGGHRSWVAPETGKKGMFADEQWKEWHCPPEQDPGHYKPVWISERGCSYTNRFGITTNDKTRYELSLTRTMFIESNPHAAPSGPVKSLLIRFAHQLTNEGTSVIDKEIGLWSLIMLPNETTGNVIVPIQCTLERSYRDNYFNKVPEGKIKIVNDIIYMQVKGGEIYKIGVPAEISAGVIASLRPSRVDSDVVLIVKKFKVDNKGRYIDRPLKEQDSNGDAIQSYNSDGTGDGCFFEIECHSPSVELKPGATQSHDIQIYVYKGPKKDILKIARKEISPRFDAHQVVFE
jgi:hypothetical protein